MKKENQIIVRCTDRQKEEIRKQAEKEELSMSAYVLQVLRDKRVNTIVL